MIDINLKLIWSLLIKFRRGFFTVSSSWDDLCIIMETCGALARYSLVCCRPAAEHRHLFRALPSQMAFCAEVWSESASGSCWATIDNFAPALATGAAPVQVRQVRARPPHWLRAAPPHAYWPPSPQPIEGRCVCGRVDTQPCPNCWWEQTIRPSFWKFELFVDSHRRFSISYVLPELQMDF